MAQDPLPNRREKLHELLKEITDYVYFQPPENLEMQFPCIVYSRAQEEVRHADNTVHTSAMSYDVTVIDEDPDSTIRLAVARLPQTRHVRWFAEENLNHDNFTVFF